MWTDPFCHLEWPKWERYELFNDGWVYPIGDGPTLYDACSERSLPTELARVVRFRWVRRRGQTAAPTDIAVARLLRFMAEFGNLGQTQLLGAPRKRSDGYLSEGDNIVWALDHAKAVDLCLSLLGLAGERRTEAITERLRRVNRHTPAGAGWTTLRVEIDESDPIGSAYRVVDAVLNANLGAAVRRIEGGKSVLQFTSLIQLIYWRVADYRNGERLRQCEECGTWFFATDARQRYCPPAGGRRESLCGKRARARGLRKE